MAGNDAEIKIGADASAVERAAATAKAVWQQAGQAITQAIGDAARSTVTSLSEVALAQGKVNFSAQHNSVREFEASSARMAVSMGRDLESVRTNIERTGVAIGKRPSEVVGWADSVKKLTYNFQGALDGMKGMSALAAETGNSVEDYRGLAAELQTVGKVTGDTTHAVGALKTQAQQLGVQGGVEAFARQVEGLGEVISHFAISSEQDFLKVTAAAAALGKGISPQAAQRVQQSVFGTVASDPQRWSRYLGRDITDEHGQVKDPAKVMEQIAAKANRTWGKDAKRILMLNFGAEAGAQMHYAATHGGFGEAAKVASMPASTTPAGKLDQLLGTDAGKRQVADAELAVSSRNLMGSSTMLGRAADALQQFAAKNPITSTLVSGALGAGASTFMGGLGSKIATMMGQSGNGGAVRGAIDLVTKGTGAAGLLGKVGLLGAAAGAGYAVGTWADNTFGLSDRISGTGAHSRIKASEDAADVDRDRALAARVAAIREENARKRTARAGMTAGFMSMMPGMGGVEAGMLGGSPTPGGRETTAAELTKALQSGVKIEIVNTTDNPISANVKASESPSAGNQS